MEGINFRKRITQTFNNTFDDWLALNGINEADVTEADIDFFMEHCALRSYDVDINEVRERIFRSLNDELSSQHVYEMLKSHDVDVVAKALQKEFGDDIKTGYKTHKGEKKTVFGIRFNTNNAFYKITKGKKLYEILSKYNYYDTNVSQENDEGGRYLFMWCEPVYTKKVTNDVNKSGIIYHVCDFRAYDKIMKSGLRPKSGKYRNFEDRVYLVYGDKPKDDIMQVISDKGYSTHPDDTKVLKIDLKKHPYNIDFYKDTMADEGTNMCYTYAYFPPKWIEDVTNNFLKK